MSASLRGHVMRTEPADLPGENKRNEEEPICQNRDGCNERPCGFPADRALCRFHDRKATTARNGGDSSHTAAMLTRIADIGCNAMTPSYAGLRL